MEDIGFGEGIGIYICVLNRKKKVKCIKVN